MPTANQPAAIRPTVGLLAATIAVMTGIAWIAARHVRAGAERHVRAEIHALRPMLTTKLAEVRQAGYNGGYVDGLGRVEPKPARHLWPVE